MIQTSADVKAYFAKEGMDLCGVASVDRFTDAPEGFHPRYILPECKSVIVIAKQFLRATLRSPNTTVPYTIVRNHLSAELDQVAVRFCYELDKQGDVALPTGTIGPTEFDTRTERFRNILSAKHSAQAAGLGVIGRNTLLITPEYGNMVWLSAIVCELELEPDPLLHIDYCNDCYICVDACPVHATGEPELKQQICAGYAFGGENGGEFKIKCYRCRTMCPYAFGTRNQTTKK